MVKKAKRLPSSGSVTLTEEPDGSITVTLDLDEQPQTDSRIMEKIRHSIAGMAYFFETGESNMELVGKAFLNGMEEGISRSKPKKEQDDPNTAKSGNYSDSKAGFTSKLNEKVDD
jgi:hypothetical protein